MPPSRRCSLSVCLCTVLILSIPARAQHVPDVIARALPGTAITYRAEIPLPASVVGHEIGSRHTEPHQVVEYFRAVASASDRVVLREHARSHEGRPLVHAIVTSPANLGRLEEIKRRNRSLSDTPDSVTDSDIEDMPGIALMSYSVHGNEASGTEASILLLYHLAAGDEPLVERILDSLVVIIEPMLNPDGRGRFTTWANRNRGGVPVADPADREHNEPWPGGRTNHYWFDLNRDYLPAQHPETRGRLALFHDWRPQIVTDFHEMGSERTYFFQPGIPSRTHPGTPPLNQQITADIARLHAAALDRIPELYYSEESFDDYYYGKWSTYPDVNGSVGILFEQASSRALIRETRNGDLHYSATVRNQFATSISSLRSALRYRSRLLRYQRDFYAGAHGGESERPHAGLLVSSKDDRSRGEAFAEVLSRHDIEVRRITRTTEVEGQEFRPEDSWYIPRRQRQSGLLDVLFETRTVFADSVFYDVSTWTLPLAFNMAVGPISRVPDGLVGGRYSPGSPSRAAIARDAVAHAISWNDLYASRVLNRLQKAGAVTRVATRAFRAMTDTGIVDFEPGTILATRGALSADSLHSALVDAVRGEHTDVHGIVSGLTPEGPDLGSPQNKVITRRRIALVTGPGASAYRAGEVWHLLSEKLGVPVTLLDAAEMDQRDLSRYTTIVMAGGRYDEAPADLVGKWVADGGHLVLTADAALWGIAGGLVDADSLSVDLDSILVGVSYADRTAARGAQRIGGIILNTAVDSTHPVGFGVGSELPVFRQGRHFVSRPSGQWAVVSRYTDQPLLSGYLPPRVLELIPDAVSVLSAQKGKGTIIVFAEIPSFRAFWPATSRMLMNAVFFGEAL